jgi:hypothetical protein
MVTPLSNLLKKKLSFNWKKEQQKAFEDLKKNFSSTLLLKFLNFTKPFKVHTNMNDFTIREVFM